MNSQIPVMKDLLETIYNCCSDKEALDGTISLEELSEKLKKYKQQDIQNAIQDAIEKKYINLNNSTNIIKLTENGECELNRLIWQYKLAND